ncbi:MAG: ribonuclease HII [Deltaproteobacteria bacterium]|nr:ribonuclease HII [Deltaproteobacteria bacterium]
MDFYEKDAFTKGFKAVAGIDEAGRGPLAGPVVAAAVIFTPPLPLSFGIRDSKILSASKRDSLVFDIYLKARSVGVGIVWPTEVDSINIHRASLEAMRRAVSSLAFKPDMLLIDGSFPIDTDIEQRPIISGDALSVSIAAASIIAKTTRDRIMDAYHLMYPDYKFSSNKGYPTKEHLEALSKAGPAPIHRRSFRGVRQDFSRGDGSAG